MAAIPSLDWYEKLIAAGFTEKQALAIVDVARDVYLARTNEARRIAGLGPVKNTPQPRTRS